MLPGALALLDRAAQNLELLGVDRRLSLRRRQPLGELGGLPRRLDADRLELLLELGSARSVVPRFFQRGTKRVRLCARLRQQLPRRLVLRLLLGELLAGRLRLGLRRGRLERRDVDRLGARLVLGLLLALRDEGDVGAVVLVLAAARVPALDLVEETGTEATLHLEVPAQLLAQSRGEVGR